MIVAEQLRILQAAQGSPALLAIATVDLVHHALPATERSQIKDALLASAVPHWCDPAFLAALLETTPSEGDRLLGYLRALTVVESFPARGEHAVNVHEATRLVLRDHLRTTDIARWNALSNRAFVHLNRATETHFRIEALYHLFAIDQHAAAAACESLDCELQIVGHPEFRYACVHALTELLTAGWLTGEAQVEVLLASLEIRNWREETAQLESEARNVAALAREASPPSGIGRAQRLLGDVFKAKGRLNDALTSFREYLSIFERLAVTDPTNTGWQHELAVAHCKVGDIAAAQGRLDDASTAFRECLAISKRLAVTDPSNAGWQRELAVAHSRIGDIAEAQGHLADASTTFQECLIAFQTLASIDPSNSDWQRELAMVYSRVGNIAAAQGRLDDASTAYHECLDIFKRLADTDPSNSDWQRQLSLAYCSVGDIDKAQGRLDDALPTFSEHLAISERLVASDPSNANWQRDLALAHNRLGQVLQLIKNDENAQFSFRSAVEVMNLAIAKSPGKNTEWEKDLENFKSWLHTETV